MTGCGNGNQSSVRLVRFFGAPIEFSYPAAWRAQYQGQGLSMDSNIIVALSTVRLRSPCRRLSASSGECGLHLMVRRLPPGGVFVVWTESGLDIPAEGVSTTIGGRPAMVSFDPAAPACGWLKPTQAITASIGLQIQMTACSRDNKDFKEEVAAMLKHLKFANT
jgi:hypothetical protein